MLHPLPHDRRGPRVLVTLSNRKDLATSDGAGLVTVSDHVERLGELERRAVMSGRPQRTRGKNRLPCADRSPCTSRRAPPSKSSRRRRPQSPAGPELVSHLIASGASAPASGRLPVSSRPRRLPRLGPGTLLEDDEAGLLDIVPVPRRQRPTSRPHLLDDRIRGHGDSSGSAATSSRTTEPETYTSSCSRSRALRWCVCSTRSRRAGRASI